MVNNLINSESKGVNIATEFNECKENLFNKKVLRYKMRRIQGKKHKMETYEINKISLSVFGDKGFVLNDGIHTLSYFHKDLKNHTWSQIKINVYKQIVLITSLYYTTYFCIAHGNETIKWLLQQKSFFLMRLKSVDKMIEFDLVIFI